MNPALGIVDGCDRDIEDAQIAGPSAASIVRGWFRRLSLGIVRQTTVNFQTVETTQWLETQGIVVPLSARQLELKAEGTRAWDWKNIFATTDLVLQPEDGVILNRNGVPTTYKVMAQLDWSLNGAVGYEIVNDYADATRR